jgi:hypothetical protein
LLGKKHRRLRLDQQTKLRRTRTGGDGIDRRFDQGFKTVPGAADAEKGGRVRPRSRRILTDRLAEFFGVAKIANNAARRAG